MGGVAAGLGLAALIYLTTLQPQLITPSANSGSNASGTPVGAKFDFYALLPERQFPRAKEAADQHAKSLQANPSADKAPPASQAPPASKRTAAAQATKEPANIQSPALIQAGSFRSAKEADRLRAELILMGLQVHVESVELGPNDAWHRVRVGPFGNEQALTQAQKLLADNKIKHMIVRLK